MCTYVGTYLILYSTWSNCNHEKISSNFRRAAQLRRELAPRVGARGRGAAPPPRWQWAARRRRPGSGAPSALHCLTRPQAAADEIGALLLLARKLARVPRMKLPHPRSCARTSPLRPSIACSRSLPLPALFAAHTYYPHPLTTLSLSLSPSLSLSLQQTILALSGDLLAPVDDGLHGRLHVSLWRDGSRHPFIPPPHVTPHSSYVAPASCFQASRRSVVSVRCGTRQRSARGYSSA